VMVGCDIQTVARSGSQKTGFTQERGAKNR